jgi:two-component system, OmpR family, sensor histidine kinase KdpD
VTIVRPEPRRRTPQARRAMLSVVVALALIGVAAVALLPFRSDLSAATVVLILLLPPLVASYAGLRASLACAVVGALVFNVFFVEPYNSIRIASDQAVVAFVVYLAIAAVLAVVVTKLRESVDSNRMRTRTLELLEGLGKGLLRGSRLDPALRSGLHDLIGLIPLQGASLSVVGAEPLTISAGDARRAERALAHLDADVDGAPHVRSLRHDGALRVFPIVGASGSLGLLAADPGDRELDPSEWSVVEGFADLVGLGVARARLEQERTRNEALVEIDRLRTALTRAVTHDLRTPLATIRAAAGALRGVEEENLRDALLDDIELAASRLTQLVTGMLDLSRIDAGALEVRRSEVPLEDLLLEAVAAVPESDGRVTVDNSQGPEIVSLDEGLMRQVVVNLVLNALTHAGDGAVEVVVGRGDRGSIDIRVVDHGPGIPEAERRRVFEPYRRLRAPAPTTGNGLGLAICEGYVEAHGGSIAVETTPGGGATFLVRLPAVAGV